MAAMLDSGYAEPALSFVRDAELTPAEKARFARPALNALGRWLNSTSPPNYTTSENLKRTRRFGDELFRVLPGKFAGTGVEIGFKDLGAATADEIEPLEDLQHNIRHIQSAELLSPAVDQPYTHSGDLKNLGGTQYLALVVLLCVHLLLFHHC